MSLPLDLLEYYQSGSASKNRSDNWTQIISLTQKNRWFFNSVCSVFFRRNPIKFWNLTCLFKQKIGGILLSGECFLISKNEMSFGVEVVPGTFVCERFSPTIIYTSRRLERRIVLFQHMTPSFTRGFCLAIPNPSDIMKVLQKSP